MRLLVCGSRNGGAWGWIDATRIRHEIEMLAPTDIIEGEAPGVDTMARTIAGTMPGVTIHAYPADWSRDGRAAGPLRNARMLREGKPDRGLAFGALWKREGASDRPHGRLGPWEPRWKPSGTGHMVSILLRAGLPVRWVATPDAVAVDLREMPEAGR